jgi:hypothetical protein
MTEADPVEEPWQVAGEEVAVALIAVGCETIAATASVQPFESVMVTV